MGLLSNQNTGNSKNRRRSAGFIIYLLVVSSLVALIAIPFLPAHATNLSSSMVEGINLLARPPILPADGGVYTSLVLQLVNTSSSIPIIPDANITVQLTSSNPQTGTVPSSVLFPAGQAYIVVPFQTTTSPGNTTVSAFASGYAPANLRVDTQELGGIPIALNITISPNQIPPVQGLTADVVVQVLDSYGNPVKLASDLMVTLSSSNSQIGNVPSTMIIPAGQSFAVATFSPTYVAGKTVVTASASGYLSGSAPVSTVGPVPRRLVVSIAPALLSDAKGVNATMSIQLQDNNSQTPALAASSVNVVVTSSNDSVVQPVNTVVTIPAGSTYATTLLVAEGEAGFANVTASAQGFEKGSALVTTSPPGDAPNSLAVYFAPSTLLPNNREYNGAVVVEQEEEFGNGSTIPALSNVSIPVYARSSDNATMQVSGDTVDITAGLTYVSLNVSTTLLPGPASITAQSPGFLANTANLLSFGAIPDTISLQFAPGSLISDGSSYNSIVVSLINSGTGSPAIAPLPTVVSLSSNSSSAGTIQSSVTIPAGETYAIANFTTSGLPGSVLITATASSYNASSEALRLVTPGATNLGLYAAPDYVFANEGSFLNVAVQLQDSNQNPVKTSVPVTIQLDCQSAAYCIVPSNVTILPGNTFVVFPVNTTTTPAVFNVSAFAVGLRPGTVRMNSTLEALQANISLVSTSLLPNGETKATIAVQSSGLPVVNATIKWVPAADAQFLSVQNKTDVNGMATVIIQSGRLAGSMQVQAVVQKAGYTDYLASTGLTVVAPLSSKDTGINMKVLSVPLWAWLVIVVVAVVAAISLIILRRRRSVPLFEEEKLQMPLAPLSENSDLRASSP
jgi:hypothetical protein